MSACSLFQSNTFLQCSTNQHITLLNLAIRSQTLIKNDVVTCINEFFTCTMSLFPASVLLSVIFSSCEERRNNPNTADLWLSCTPLRLVMVSSRFCRRSRTFCTVLFLWDSGSAGGTHTSDINQKKLSCWKLKNVLCLGTGAQRIQMHNKILLETQSVKFFYIRNACG